MIDNKEEKREFVFNKDNLAKANIIIAKYPEDRKKSAMLPLLDLAQRQNGGYLSYPVIDYIAKMLDVIPIKVYEVASFYTMFNLKPVGKNHIQICTTTPCWLRGSDDIVSACKKELGINVGETTNDQEFTITEVECLGACINAPIVQINDDYHENLTTDKVIKIIQQLKTPKIKSKTKKSSLNNLPK